MDEHYLIYSTIFIIVLALVAVGIMVTRKKHWATRALFVAGMAPCVIVVLIINTFYYHAVMADRFGTLHESVALGDSIAVARERIPSLQFSTDPEVLHAPQFSEYTMPAELPPRTVTFGWFCGAGTYYLYCFDAEERCIKKDVAHLDW